MSNHYHVVRNKLSAQSLDSWSVNDKWVIVIGMMAITFIALPMFVRRDGTAAVVLLVGLLVLAALLMRLNDGNARLYEEFLLHRRHLLNQQAVKKFVPKPTRPDASNAFVPHFTQNVIEAKDEFGHNQRVPILSHLDPEIPIDYVYIRVEGGKFVGGSNEEQMAATKELGSIIDKTLMQTELPAGVTPLYIRAPLNMNEINRYFAHSGNPLITQPDQYEIVNPQQRALIDQLREDSDEMELMPGVYGMVEGWSLFVISIRRDKTTLRLNRGGAVPDDDVYNLPVLTLARTLVERLRSSPILGYRAVEILKEYELCMVVRQSWDIVGIHDFYHQITPYRTSYEKGLITDQKFADIMWSEIGCLPKRFWSPKPSYMEADGNRISLIRMEELPEWLFPEVANSHLKQGARDVWLRHSAPSISGSAKTERGRLYGQQVSSTNLFKALFENFAVVPDIVKKRQRELESLSQSIENIAVVQRYNVLTALVSASTTRLRTVTTEYMGTMRGLSYSPELIKLTSIHQRKLFEAVLAIDS